MSSIVLMLVALIASLFSTICGMVYKQGNRWGCSSITHERTMKQCAMSYSGLENDFSA